MEKVTSALPTLAAPVPRFGTLLILLPALTAAATALDAGLPHILRGLLVLTTLTVALAFVNGGVLGVRRRVTEGVLFTVAVFVLNGFLLTSLGIPLTSTTATLALALWAVVAAVAVRPRLSAITLPTAWPKVDRRTAVLAPLVTVGVLYRTLSVFVPGVFLLGTDPYRYLRAITAIVETGGIPSYDPLVPLAETMATIYHANLGYHLLFAQLHLLTDLPIAELLKASAPVFYVLTFLSYLMLAELFMGPTGVTFAAVALALPAPVWFDVYVMAINPLAENIGLVVFMYGLYLLAARRSPLTLGVLLGVSAAVHPATLLFLAILGGIFGLSVLLRERDWGLLRYGVVAAIPCVVVAVPFVLSFGGSQQARLFADAAVYLTSYSNRFWNIAPVLLLSPCCFGIPQCAGLVLAIGYLLLRGKSKARWFLVAVPMTLVALLSFANTVTGKQVLASSNLLSILIFSHRTFPYFVPMLYLTVAAFLDEFSRFALVPAASLTRWQRGMAVVTGVVLTVWLYEASMYGIVGLPRLTQAAMLDRFAGMYQWIAQNTRRDDLFIANLFDPMVQIRALARRPVLTSISFEDLTVPDYRRRFALQGAVFLGGFSDETTKELVRQYYVRYAVVVRNDRNYSAQPDAAAPAIVVLDQAPFEDQIARVDQLPYFQRAYTDLPDGVVVYAVNDHIDD